MTIKNDTVILCEWPSCTKDSINLILLPCSSYVCREHFELDGCLSTCPLCEARHEFYSLMETSRTKNSFPSSPVSDIKNRSDLNDFKPLRCRLKRRRKTGSVNHSANVDSLISCYRMANKSYINVLKRISEGLGIIYQDSRHKTTADPPRSFGSRFLDESIMEIVQQYNLCNRYVKYFNKK